MFQNTYNHNLRSNAEQGGRSWQPFGEHKNGQGNFCQAWICYFHDKCVVFACNCKFGNLIQYNMQYIPWNTAHLAQETLFLTKKSTSFCPKTTQKCKIATNLNIATKKHILGLKFFFRIQTFRWRPFVHNFCHPFKRLTSSVAIQHSRFWRFLVTKGKVMEVKNQWPSHFYPYSHNGSGLIPSVQACRHLPRSVLIIIHKLSKAIT